MGDIAWIFAQLKDKNLTLFQTNPYKCQLRVCCTSLEKTLWKNEELLVTTEIGQH